MTQSDPGSPQEQNSSSEISNEKDSAESEKLSLDNLEAISGGVMKRPAMKKPACSTGLMSTCKVNDTLESWCAC
jgi:hypothetical protein